MSDQPFGDAEIEFPAEAHFRLICIASDDVEKHVREIARTLGVEDGLSEGNTSKKGSYQTFQLTVMVESKEHLHSIDAAYRGQDFVKMVL